MQLDHDPMGSEETSASGLSGLADELIDGEDDESKTPPREGLPARFRMRHTPHYVDELLGDAPLRTVREIQVSEIESPIDDRAGIDDLERSIRRLGVIEPLLVGRHGAQYRVIAGMRRLRAAQRIGLDTVPCLVHDLREVDEARLLDMRDAAAQRFVVPPPAPDVEDVMVSTDSSEPEPRAQEPAIGEAAPGSEFVSALLPAMNAAGNDRLRWGVLTDLAAVEVARARTIGMAHDASRSARPIARVSVHYVALVNHVVSAVATEARLRGVRIDLSAQDSNPEIFIDGGRCRDALTGLLQCLLALAPRTGTVLGVRALIPSIRPALIVECLLHESDPELSPEAFARFFEAGWREHPCGVDGSAILAMFALIARAHGGRVDVKPAAASGCLVKFVVPKLDG